MTVAHEAIGVAIVALFAVCAGLGSLSWWRRRPSRSFWALLRTGQALLVVEAALGGLLAAVGRHAGDLHLLYGLLPLGVSFAAEQLRVSAAETVLESRGLESARAVGELAEDEQRAVVAAILRREIGVMTVAAAVVVALALRATYT
jgi:hypothetical protein